MSNRMVISGLARLVVSVAERHGLARAELLERAALSERDLADPEAFVPHTALFALLRTVMQRTGEAALGLELARAYDLKAMGRFGYALMASLTLRQRLELHQRYSELHNPLGRVSLRVEGDRFIGEWNAEHVPQDVLPVLMDCAVAFVAMQYAKDLNTATPDLKFWLPFSERPHHREIRALVSGPIMFDAPQFRVEIDARELDRRLGTSDPHLFDIAKRQLEDQLVAPGAVVGGNVLEQVRARLAVRLANDASLEQIARELRRSPRTLRRQLRDLGASFQDLLDEIRQARATTYLLETDRAIKQVAADLGYSDSSNFRRAFRRWTGAAPEAFRAAQRARMANNSEPAPASHPGLEPRRQADSPNRSEQHGCIDS